MYCSDLEPFLNFSNYENWPSIHTVSDKNNQRNSEKNLILSLFQGSLWSLQCGKEVGAMFSIN